MSVFLIIFSLYPSLPQLCLTVLVFLVISSASVCTCPTLTSPSFVKLIAAYLHASYLHQAYLHVTICAECNRGDRHREEDTLATVNSLLYKNGSGLIIHSICSLSSPLRMSGELAM